MKSANPKFICSQKFHHTTIIDFNLPQLLKMQFTSIILFLSAAVSASALPGALQVRQAAGTNGTASHSIAAVACNTAGEIIKNQFAEMSKLKAQNISIPPYLAGYYSAINSGRQEIGCPGSIAISARDFTPLKGPCEVIKEQHERMMVLVNRFEANQISVAPFIAGFLSATLDGNKGLKCPSFTGSASNAAQGSNSNSTDSGASS